MAETIKIETEVKQEKYNQLIPQIESLISYESDLVANLANVTAVLKEVFGFFWVGFYRVTKDELVLGPFQGPLACTRIQKGKGVCGIAWQKEEALLVPDVEEFPGHIACSSQSKSEIVIPIFDHNKKVVLILDVDSDIIDDFDEVDRIGLISIASLISKLY